MVTSPDVPDQGHLVWLDFSPHAGHEQGGRRPGVVLTQSKFNARVGNALSCPITSKAKGYPFEVPLPTGLTTTGVVLVDQLRCVDWVARHAVFIEHLPPDTTERILLVARSLLVGR
jgi:mRNA interferase MazF